MEHDRKVKAEEKEQKAREKQEKINKIAALENKMAEEDEKREVPFNDRPRPRPRARPLRRTSSHAQIIITPNSDEEAGEILEVSSVRDWEIERPKSDSEPTEIEEETPKRKKKKVSAKEKVSVKENIMAARKTMSASGQEEVSPFGTWHATYT
jgi:hypothetical protein